MRYLLSISIVVIVLITCLFGGCSSASISSPTKTLSINTAAINDLLINDEYQKYNQELGIIKALALEDFNNANDLLTSNQIAMKEFNMRTWYITYIQAQRIKYVDNKTDYAALNQILWIDNNGIPPHLGWYFPGFNEQTEGHDAEFEQVMAEYIVDHYDRITKLGESIN